MDGITITKVERHPEHDYWTARVTLRGTDTLNVDKEHGSWMARVNGPGGEHRVELHRDICAALQDKVRVLEKRELEAA